MGRPELRDGDRHVARGGIGGRTTGPPVLFITAFLVMILLCFPADYIAPAFGEDRPDPGLSAAGPTITGMTVQQAGGRLALIELKGNELPRPDILGTDSDRLVLLFADTVLPSGYWERVYNIPLVKKVELSQELQGVKMTVLGNMRLHLKDVLGEAPANRLQLHVAAPGEAPEERVMETVDPGEGWVHDPMRIDAPVSMELRDSDLRDAFRMLGR